MNLPWSKSRLGVAAGLVAGSAGLALLSGLGPAPALLSIAAARGADDTPATSTTGSTATDDNPAAAPADGTRVGQAAGAGTVTVDLAAGRLELLSATPAAGWSVEDEQSAGTEVEVDFRRGAERVQVDLEVEDGAVRERLRIRDDATGSDVRTEDGTIVQASGPGADDLEESGTSGPGVSGGGTDSSGPSANRGPSASGDGDHGHDHRDDHGGDAGRGGTDDPPGDDHGGDH
jgi:hypothetical protein